MAVIAQIVVESRRYSGWTDPKYPIGHWQAALGVVGNLTGGSLAVDLVFQLGTNPALNSQIYSVERFGIQTSDAADRFVRIQGVNMGGPSNRGFTQGYHVFLSAATGVSASHISGNQLLMIPWFLGSQRTPGITASFSFIGPNVDGITFVFEAEGYRWSPRSVLVDGGPQRPPTGLYAR